MNSELAGDTPQDPTGRDEAASFQRDLYLYWRELRETGGFALTTRGYVTRPALRRIRALLGRVGASMSKSAASNADVAESDDRRLLFVRRLLERLRLIAVTADGARLVAGEPTEMSRYLALPLPERLRICARLWVAGGWWPDALDASAPLPPLLAPLPPRVALARRRIFEQLGGCAAGEAFPVPPAAHLPTAASKRARFAMSGRRRGANASRSQSGADDMSLRAALLGPLAWMGFVIPLSDGDGIDAWESATDCRVGLPLAALRPEADVSELIEPAGRVVAQADLSLVAYPPLSGPRLLTLDTCAECVTLDIVARYRLTREAAQRARTIGWTARERLAALTGEPLPANVATTLRDWDRRNERLQLTPNVIVLEVDDPAVLDHLLADPAAQAWVERRLTPTAALLVTAHTPRVRDWLLRHGEAPAWRRATTPSARREERSR